MAGYYGEPYDEIAYRIHEMASNIELGRQIDGVEPDLDGPERIDRIAFTQDVDLWRLVVSFDDQGMERIEWTRAGVDGCRSMRDPDDTGPAGCDS